MIKHLLIASALVLASHHPVVHARPVLIVPLVHDGGRPSGTGTPPCNITKTCHRVDWPS